MYEQKIPDLPVSASVLQLRVCVSGSVPCDLDQSEYCGGACQHVTIMSHIPLDVGYGQL